MKVFTKIKQIQSNVLYVDKGGNAQFRSINDAINYAKTYCSPDNRVVIKIGAGIYEEEINLNGNYGIDLEGSGMFSTVVKHDGVQPNAPLRTTGTGTFSNMSFEGVGVNNYGVHIEAQDNANSGAITFVNCYLYGLNHAGLGAGLGDGFTVRLINCLLETRSATYSALYLHNFPSPTSTFNQWFYAINCNFINNGGGIPIIIENARTVYSDVVDYFSNLYLSFENCNARKPYIRFNDGGNTLSYLPTSGEIQLLDSSCGNNMVGLNYDGGVIYHTAMCMTTTDSIVTIPIQKSVIMNYEFNIESVTIPYGDDVTSSCTLEVNVPYSYIQIVNSARTMDNTLVLVRVRATPKSN